MTRERWSRHEVLQSVQPLTDLKHLLECPPVPSRFIHFPVSYTGSFSEMYIRFAQECVRSERVAQLFEHLVNFGCLSQHNPAWPSWVPDWSTSGLDNPSVSFEEQSLSNIRLLKDGRCLVLVTKLLGSVQFTSGTWPVTSTPSQLRKLAQNFIAEAEPSKADDEYPYHKRLEAFAGNFARVVTEKVFIPDDEGFRDVFGASFFEADGESSTFWQVHPDDENASMSTPSPAVQKVCDIVGEVMGRNSLFYLNEDELGIGPPTVQPGDVVMSLPTAYIGPEFLLRPCNVPQHLSDHADIIGEAYRLIGTCHVAYPRGSFYERILII